MAKGPRKGKPGTSMGGLETTPARRKRDAKRLRTQEQAWAAKASPVKTYFVDPDTLSK